MIGLWFLQNLLAGLATVNAAAIPIRGPHSSAHRGFVFGVVVALLFARSGAAVPSGLGLARRLSDGGQPPVPLYSESGLRVFRIARVMEQMDEAALVQAAQAGDRDAFAQLFAGHFDSVYDLPRA